MPDAIEQGTAELTTRTQTLLTCVDGERRETEARRIVDDLLRQYPYLPIEQQHAAKQQYFAKEDQRAGEALHALIERIREDQDDVAKVIAHAKRAPTALQAFEQLHGSSSATSALGVLQLEELRIQRYARELVGASPMAVHDAYVAAVNQGGDDADSVIRFIEERLPNTWSGSARTPEDAMAVQALAKAIAKQQDARVPPSLRAWEGAIVAARKAVTAAQDLHRVRPRPPKPTISKETEALVDGVRRTRTVPTRRTAKAS